MAQKEPPTIAWMSVCGLLIGWLSGIWAELGLIDETGRTVCPTSVINS